VDLARAVGEHDQDPVARRVVAVGTRVFVSKAVLELVVVQILVGVAKLGRKRDQSDLCGREEVPVIGRHAAPPLSNCPLTRR